MPQCLHMCAMTHSWLIHDSSICHEWIMPQCLCLCICLTRMSHGTLECVTTHRWMAQGTWLIHNSSVTHSRVPWLIDMRAMTHPLLFMCAMTYSHVCHDSFGNTRVTSCNNGCHDSFICVPWLIDMCAMTHSYVCFIRVAYLHLKTTHSYVWHDSLICVPWLIHMCASHVWHTSISKQRRTSSSCSLKSRPVRQRRGVSNFSSLL